MLEKPFILLLHLRGKKFSADSQLSSPTNNINAANAAMSNLFGALGRTWLYGSMIAGGVMLVVFAALIVDKWSAVVVNFPLTITLGLASTWIAVGLPLIWHFETNTVPTFNAAARAFLVTRKDQQELDRIANKPLENGFIARAVQTTWICLVAWAFWTADEFVGRFGIRTFDWWWFLLGLGTLALARYTAFGFLAVLKTIRLVTFLGQRDRQLKLDPYHEDGTGGLEGAVTLSVRTSFQFASGALFLPLMIALARQAHGDVHGYISTTIIALFVLFILAPFLYSILFMHRKIVQTKAAMTLQLRHSLRTYSKSMAAAQNHRDPKLLEFVSNSAYFKDVALVRNWPVRQWLVVTVSTLATITVGVLSREGPQWFNQWINSSLRLP